MKFDLHISVKNKATYCIKQESFGKKKTEWAVHLTD